MQIARLSLLRRGWRWRVSHLLSSSTRGPRIGGVDVGTGEGDDSGADADGVQLHPQWAQLERRLLNRRTKNVGEGPVGRAGKRTWEEDFWLQGGLYDTAEESTTPSESSRGAEDSSSPPETPRGEPEKPRP